MEIKRKIAKTDFSEKVSSVTNDEVQKIEVKGVPFWQRGWFSSLVFFVPVFGMLTAYKGGHKKMFIIATWFTFNIVALILGSILRIIVGNATGGGIEIWLGTSIPYLAAGFAAYKVNKKKWAMVLVGFGLICFIGMFPTWKADTPTSSQNNTTIVVTAETDKTKPVENLESKKESKVEEQSSSVPKKLTLMSNGNIYSTSATSELKGKQGSVYYSGNLVDNNTATAWAEGVKGYGNGEGVVFTFRTKVYLSALDVWNGYQKEDMVFNNNSMPKSIRVVIPNKFDKVYTLDKEKGSQRILLSSEGIYTDKVQLHIVDVHKGMLWKDTCISEVKFLILE